MQIGATAIPQKKSTPKRRKTPAGPRHEGAGTALRSIPSVEQVLSSASLAPLAERVGRRLLTARVRDVLGEIREEIRSGRWLGATNGNDGVTPALVEARVIRSVEQAAAFSLRPVINATGVILHTNLGRAPLSREMLEHAAEIAVQYSNLEFDLAAAKRGERDVHISNLLTELLGAEAAIVVNNNAAAVLLTLNALAEGGDVIVSRGELIEIGGSFRIPEIMRKSGAVLREVGTTNRTRISDYRSAISENTRLLLRVHPSNFRIVGFAERPALEELVDLAHRHGLALVEDLGSGCLEDLALLGVTDEPTVAPSLKAGVDVVTFSGDKLLGGPQAGIITGKREPLAMIRKNPLFRALRVDKLTIAALEATVKLYLKGDLKAIPAWRMILLTRDEIAVRAERLAGRIGALEGFRAGLRDGESVMGGGSTPGQSLPTVLVALSHHRHSARELEEHLRRGRPPVIARVERDELLIDLRTVEEEQEEDIVRALEHQANVDLTGRAH